MYIERFFVQVAKNRFDGELGIMLLKFNKDTLSFFKDVDKAQVNIKQSKDDEN